MSPRTELQRKLTFCLDGLLTIYIADTAVNALLFHFGRSLQHRSATDRSTLA